ncbi:hypothetical protein [Agromyces humi]|uniref:hypothetical protein n=1 Tax=Agromyces humi TaxID=1766800 RepID=UPI001356995A|nr:hypothetical protein [Agromyces humi]
MKRAISALSVAALGAGLALVGTVAPAAAADSTSTPGVAASCISLDVNLTGYATDPGAAEVTEERVVTPAIAEVSHTDYVYTKHLGLGPATHVSHKWSGADLIYDWTWYKYSGQSQKHVEVEAQAEVTETVVVTPAVPANATPNTVTVEVGGEVVLATTTFGTDFSQSFPLDKHTEQPYTVTVASFDGQGGGVFTGTSPACDLGDWNANAVITPSCGSALVTVTNDELLADRINGTYSAVVYVDGDAEEFLAPQEGETQTKTLTFAEDSGSHVIVVRTGPAHGDVELARATVSSDCVVNPGNGGEEPTDPTGTLTVTGNLVPGGTITVTGADFAPNTEHGVELHSTPASLGNATTDAEGGFQLTTTIPAGTPTGSHDIVVVLAGTELTRVGIVISPAAATTAPAATGTTGASTSSTSASDDLAETGVDGSTIVLLALALLAFGGLAVGTTRVVRSRV